MDFAGTPEEKKVVIINKDDYKNYVPGQPKRPIIADRVAPCYGADIKKK
jgi:hypothetical protein